MFCYQRSRIKHDTPTAESLSILFTTRNQTNTGGILLRHGESEWNALNQYTEWCDVNLTKRVDNETRAAGRLLIENGIEIDHAFTSVLKRASFTCNMCLNMA